jgi:hypothetical protein
VTEHYAEAFAVRDGCFRMVADHAGRPTHCSEPPAWAGTFEGGQGRTHTVQACDGHCDGLINARRIVQSKVDDKR